MKNDDIWILKKHFACDAWKCFRWCFFSDFTKIARSPCYVEQKQNIRLDNFVRYFTWNWRSRHAKYGQIRFQWLKINKNWQFCFWYTQFLSVMIIFVNGAAILDKRYQRKMLVCNPIYCHTFKSKIHYVNLHWNWICESAAKENTKKAVMTLQKWFLVIFKILNICNYISRYTRHQKLRNSEVLSSFCFDALSRRPFTLFTFCFRNLF